MKVTRFLRLMAAVGIALLTTAPGPALAAPTQLIVQRNPTSSNFDTIQHALDHVTFVRQDPTHASDPFIIQVQADTYTDPLTINVGNVQIVGDKTSATFLSGAAAQINVTGVQNVVIRNFTFQTATSGISVKNSSAIDIRNNVFDLSSSGSAISITGSPSTSIINNTFANNGTAINTDSDITITNNIFYSNTKAINSNSASPILSFDDFFGNTSNGVANLGSGSLPDSTAGKLDSDPLFVNVTAGDFHLQSNSPAANSGNPLYRNSFNNFFDMGAYGGPSSDIISPPTITGVTPSFTPPSTISLTWTASSASSVTYRVYYGTSTGKYDAVGSPLAVTTPSATLTDLPFSEPAAPAAPTQLIITSLNRALQLNWTAAAGATGYRIFYSTTGDTKNNPTKPLSLDVGVTTTTTIPNLVNGTPYFVAIESLAQPQYFIAVTAVIDSSLASAPGGPNESQFSKEISQGVGTALVSDLVIGAPNSPEAIAPFPNLKNEGCFIATAAYGFYSAPQVQVLRDFRDRYLLTNAPGRAFLSWYYHYGPIGAHFINVHPWLKPPVRLALLPLVIGAFLLTHTPPMVKMALVLLTLAVSVVRLLRRQRKMLVHSGGMH